jgi:integrase
LYIKTVQLGLKSGQLLLTEIRICDIIQYKMKNEHTSMHRESLMLNTPTLRLRGTWKLSGGVAPKRGRKETSGLARYPDAGTRHNVWELIKTEWLASKGRKSGRSQTVATYRTAIQQFFAWAGVAPWAVTPALAEAWAVHLSEEGKVVKKRSPITGAIEETRGPLAASSINVKLAALTSLYDYAGRHPQHFTLWGADRPNPFRAVKRRRIPPYGGAQYPTVEEMASILAQINTDSLTGKRDFALIYTYTFTCLRFDQLIGVRWGDIQPGGDGHYRLRYRQQEGQAAFTDLDAVCYQAICAYLDAARRLDTMRADDYVFTPLFPERSRNLGHAVNPGRPIANSTANRILKKRARRAGVNPGKAHMRGLRHAGALRRYRQGMARKSLDLAAFQKLLGHRKDQTTMVYVRKLLAARQPFTAKAQRVLKVGC